MDKRVSANDFARHLRKNQTEAEMLLWKKLRNKRLNNFRFRRQQRIGPYIVDFICFSKRLIIEVDGGQHASLEGKRQDKLRSEWLEKEGYRIIRFWDNEVLKETDTVLAKIYLTLSPKATSLSSNRRGVHGI